MVLPLGSKAITDTERGVTVPVTISEWVHDLWFVEQVEGDSCGGRWFIIRLLPPFPVKKPFPVVWGFCSIIWLQWGCLEHSINSLFPKFKLVWKATRKCLCAYSSSLVNALQLQACRKVDKLLDSVILNRDIWVFGLLDTLKSREDREINVYSSRRCNLPLNNLRFKNQEKFHLCSYWILIPLHFVSLLESIRKEVQDYSQ